MAQPPISRGFRGRKPATQSDRIPPGQHLTHDFPVLSAGPTPHVSLADWSFSLDSGGKVLKEWTWDEFNALPQTELKTDIHCVTTWSKLDTHWRGVTIDDLLKAAGLAEPPGDFTMAHCDGDYTTNVPADDLVGGKGMVATHYEGEPLAPEHGGPARLLVPHLYFWKSAKWVRTLEFIKERRARISGNSSATISTAIRGKSSVMRATEDRRAAASAMADRRSARPDRRNTARAQPRARTAGLAGPQAGPACRCAAHRRRRLSGAAQLFDRVRAGIEKHHPHGRAHRGRRGLALSRRSMCRRATSSNCAGRSAGISSGPRRWAGRYS